MKKGSLLAIAAGMSAIAESWNFGNKIKQFRDGDSAAYHKL